jgi:hypothetical protein
MKDNRHVQSIPQDVLTQSQTKINEVKTLLAPYIVALTPSERHELPKMGEKTISFVEKAFDFAQQNPNLVPPYLDMTAFGADREDFGSLRGEIRSRRPGFDSLREEFHSLRVNTESLSVETA